MTRYSGRMLLHARTKDDGILGVRLSNPPALLGASAASGGRQRQCFMTPIGKPPVALLSVTLKHNRILQRGGDFHENQYLGCPFRGR